MDGTLLAVFVPACFALNMIPGPNNLLAMSHGQRYGLGPALMGGLGRLGAFAVMIFLAASGLAALLYASETIFLTIKILGAAYLFWVAIQLWRAEPGLTTASTETKRAGKHLAYREFMLAAGNPKAILIFTAFLPQFIDVGGNTGQQFFVLGATFLGLEWLAIAIYAGCGVYLSQWFARPQMRKLFNRSCASLIAALGIGMLLDRKAQ